MKMTLLWYPRRRRGSVSSSGSVLIAEHMGEYYLVYWIIVRASRSGSSQDTIMNVFLVHVLLLHSVLLKVPVLCCARNAPYASLCPCARRRK